VHCEVREGVPSTGSWRNIASIWSKIRVIIITRIFDQMGLRARKNFYFEARERHKIYTKKAALDEQDILGEAEGPGQ
jgi:hypothetical protein